MAGIVRRFVWIVICVGVCGCQGQSAPPVAPPTKTAPPVISAAPEPEEDPAAKTKPQKPAEPDAPPVAAVRTLLREIEAGNLAALAAFLPKSYGEQLESLLRSFVEKTPDDVWQRLHAVLLKAVTVLKKQSASAPDDDLTSDERKKLAAALDQLAEEATWDRANWKSWDLSSLLQGPASTLFAAWQRSSSTNATLLSETDVRLVELNGDRATLEIRSELDAEPEKVEFVLVEGKWIPKSLAESWPAAMEQALEKLKGVDEAQVAEWAGHIKPLLLQVEGTLEQMLRAERPEEAQLGWWQIQSLLVQGRQDLLEPGPPPRVEVRVTGELSDDALSDLLDRLQQATDHPDLAEYVTFPTATGTSIQISPVKSFDEFVKRLTFAKIKSQSADERNVEIEFAPEK